MKKIAHFVVLGYPCFVTPFYFGMSFEIK